jgi:NAD(P)-dependent dehydrogenase (short-subunit alcohol dehydrogenase family)
MSMARLDGKVAVITGGASGMGASTVQRFAAEGARIVIADLQDDNGHTLADTLGGSAVYQRTNVADESEVMAAIARAIDEFGRLDVLFNNAGFAGTAGSIESTPMDEYDVTMDVLLKGVVLGMKHAAPIMKAQGSGSIISTASVAGLGGGRGPHVYSAAKAAVINLTRSVALELAVHNVRVNCICPGAIATPLLAQGAGGDTELIKPFLQTVQPLPRSGVGEDIAGAALWLSSDDAAFVTGQAIVVDGGMTAGPRWQDSPWAAAAAERMPMTPPGQYRSFEPPAAVRNDAQR